MDLAGRRVLVVDESLTVRMDLDEAFRAVGWTTVLCSSANAAHDAIGRSRFDAIVLDPLLPDGGGVEILRVLQRHPGTADIPVMLLSTEAEAADHVKDLPAGAVEFVGKPYDRASLVSRARRLMERASAATQPPRATILAVDDSRTYLDVLARQLRRDGHDVLPVESGDEALNVLRVQGVDCILLDMLMPGMSGQELCRRIKDSPAWRTVPVIMLTGREDRAAIVDSLNAGADDYVSKSGDFEVLRARLNAQLRRRHFELEAHRKDLEVVEARAAITERQRVEEELRAANRAAERARAAAEDASRAKDHFLAILSHELRTPLTPVLAAVSLLQREPMLPERTRERLELIRRNVELQSRLIDDLLDLTRIVRGKVELDRRRIELCTILERAAEVCRPDIDARRLHFGIDYGPRPYVVEADVARLQQVFWNLLKNAIKFTPQGGCVGLRCRPDNGQVVVEVNDTGIGIDPAAIGRIFDAFAQAELSITRQFGGLGLGLAISKVLVEMHGGTLTAYSDGHDKGATFTVRLPIIGAGLSAGATAASLHRSERFAPALDILLVEDHGDTIAMMVDVLEASGHRVQTAGDVAAALDITGRRRFDLVISDLGLPDRSGLDLMRMLRARGETLPAIALSGYGQEKDREQSRAAGFQMHLVKPIDGDQLIEAIAKVISG